MGGLRFINRVENVEYVEGVTGLAGESFRRQSTDKPGNRSRKAGIGAATFVFKEEVDLPFSPSG